MSDSAHHSKPSTAGLPIVGSAAREKDPVCGMLVDPAKAAGKVEHEKRNYYFCSPRCAERFSKEPLKFLAASGTEGMEHPSPPVAHEMHAHAQAAAAVAASKTARYILHREGSPEKAQRGKIGASGDIAFGCRLFARFGREPQPT